ncbi:DNA recombination protein RmuC [Anditalea andensis]|uniref:Recombinase RmuC n=1 Tax=Anditalea andensis TaxID=1048983 RepID=A0A074L4F3_9BACT|nr:DNA recombination protein RmuC [Anditalea andensis]KEO75370.1 recombinase RmuC [Anditalea andensis]
MEFLLLSIIVILGVIIIYLFRFKASGEMISQEHIQVISSLKSENAVIKEKLSQLSIQLQDKKEELSRFLNENRLAELHVQQLFREKTELETELKSVKSYLNALSIRESELKDKLEQCQESLSQSRIALSGVNQEKEGLKEKLETQAMALDDIGHKFSAQFELLANKILEDKAIRFSQQNKDSIEKILQPLGHEFGEFKKKVEETYDKESKQRFSLEERVKELVGLNQQISEEAKNLTRALKGNAKTQGNWGEAILETILQNSGLEKNRHYVLQEFLKDASGEYLLGPNGKRMQPDVTITYPDDRKVIIDSKVSLVAYEQYYSSDDIEVQKLSLSAHLKSIKNHIDQLSAKQYDGYDKVLDFVIMFVPMEAAYITAVQADPNLWEYAYKKRILLISSSNLIAALKMIKDLWVRTEQTLNALEIAERGGKLYDKFVTFLSSLESIGSHLEKSQTAYTNAMKQIKTGNGNLIGQVEKLKKLGVKTTSSIPEKVLKQ